MNIYASELYLNFMDGILAGLNLNVKINLYVIEKINNIGHFFQSAEKSA
jgi:hypothetical protein